MTGTVGRSGAIAGARRPRLGAWLGIFALLLYGATPLAHHGGAGALPTGIAELCTPDGLRLVQVPSGDQDDPGDAGQRPYSCPLCQAQGHAPAILPTVATALETLSFPAAAPPPRAPDVPRPAAVASLGSRAPPSVG